MKIVLAVNLAVLVVVSWGFAGEYTRSRQLQKEIQMLQETAGELEQDNLELTDLGKKFASSGRIEREARLKLNLKKPGEEVVIIREEDDHGIGIVVDETSPARDSEDSASNVRKWLHYFF